MDKLNDLFTRIITKLNKKVDSVDGKGLSTNDFTTEEKAKLSGIEDGAQVNTIETISLNGTNVEPDEDKNVEIKAYNPSNTTPLAPAATGSVGSEMAFARGDHVHPYGDRIADSSLDGPYRSGIQFAYGGNVADQFEKQCYPIIAGRSRADNFPMFGAVTKQFFKQSIGYAEISDINASNFTGILPVEKGGTGQSTALSIFDLCPDGIMHRNLFRGKNLGDSVTAEQLAAIKNGTFKDLFIGDYWVIDGVTWLIADMDYFYQAGDTTFAFAKHHLVIIPQGNLYNARMNSANTTEGGYVNSEMYTTNLENAKTKIKAAFGDMVQTHRDILINATTERHPSGFIWTDSEVELMTEVMVYGTYHYAVMNPGSYLPAKYTTARQQFAIFALNPYYAFIGRIWYWLRDVVSATYFAHCTADGGAGCNNASYFGGVRPYFCIGSNDPDADMPVEDPEMMDEYMQSDEALSPEFEKPIDPLPETEDEPLTE